MSARCACGRPGEWELEDGRWTCEAHFMAAIVDDEVAEHRRDEGDDRMNEARAEREVEWRNGWR